MEGQGNQQLLGGPAQSEAAKLSQVEVDVAVDPLCDEFVSCKGYVAEAGLCVTGRIDVIVFDPA